VATLMPDAGPSRRRHLVPCGAGRR
jgi:hypothetical protein